MEGYIEIVQKYIETGLLFRWLGAASVEYVQIMEHDEKFHAKSFLMVLAGANGYTAAILDLDTRDVCPVPGSKLYQFTKKDDAILECMYFDAALKSVRYYDDHMMRVKDQSEAQLALNEKRAREQLDEQKRKPWLAKGYEFGGGK